jgi:RNase P/RNase MRP subunit POP5
LGGFHVRAHELIQAASSGDLDALLTERAAEITPQLAEQARELAFQAIAAGDLDVAEIATQIAAKVSLRLGDYKLAVRNQIDTQRVAYMRADKPEQYAAVRTQLLDSVNTAMEVGARPEAFKAAMIAADCSYWSAIAGDAHSQDLTLQTLRDVIAAAELLPASLPLTVPASDAHRFVALIAAIASRAMSMYFRPAQKADEADKLLHELATAAARVVPADYAFERLDEKGRTGQTAQAFASLADQYGS